MTALTENPWLAAAPRKIYVASSWRNEHQQGIVAELRAAGHDVYDFHNPAPGNNGFKWKDAHGDGATTIQSYLLAVTSPVALQGFDHDKGALDWCDTCVMVLPCGRSAHLEAGYAAGRGKHVIFWLHPDRFEPELMYLLGDDFVVAP